MSIVNVIKYSHSIIKKYFKKVTFEFYIIDKIFIKQVRSLVNFLKESYFIIGRYFHKLILHSKKDIIENEERIRRKVKRSYRNIKGSKIVKTNYIKKIKNILVKKLSTINKRYRHHKKRVGHKKHKVHKKHKKTERYRKHKHHKHGGKNHKHKTEKYSKKENKKRLFIKGLMKAIFTRKKKIKNLTDNKSFPSQAKRFKKEFGVKNYCDINDKPPLP